jgi:hypothetical protein
MINLVNFDHSKQSGQLNNGSKKNFVEVLSLPSSPSSSDEPYKMKDAGRDDLTQETLITIERQSTFKDINRTNESSRYSENSFQRKVTDCAYPRPTE